MSSPASTSASPLSSSAASPSSSPSFPSEGPASLPTPPAPAPTSTSQDDSPSSQDSLRRTRRARAVMLSDSQGSTQSAGSSRHTLLEFLQNEDLETGNNLQQGQEAGNARRSNAASLERKRRLTSASDNAGRARPAAGIPSVDSGSVRSRPGPSATQPWERPSSGLPGSSSENAIDLSGSQESVSRQLNSLRHRENSFTDYELPRWQPDSEVSKCPICDTQFSFWYRKHHCRKCGRVVCASCSPHRITIPRQFIVRPPESNRQLSALLQPNPSEAQVISLIEDDEGSSSVSADTHTRSRGQQRLQQQRDRYPPNSALGGGEEVRLCNPCVPDPNPEPPRRYSSSIGSLSGSGWLSSTPSTRPDDASGSSHAPVHRRSALPGYYRNGGAYRRNTNPFHRPSVSLSSAANMPPSQAARDLRRQRGRGMIFQPETPEIQSAAQGGLPDEGLPSYGSFDYTVVPNFRGMPPRYQSTQLAAGGLHPHYSPPAYSSPSGTSLPNSRQRSSSSVSHPMPSHHRGPSNDFLHGPSPSSSSRNRPLPPAPPHHHRPIDENDICPICARLLPPRAADGSEEAREAHVRGCIEGHGNGHGHRHPASTSSSSTGRRTSQSNYNDNNHGNHGNHHADRPVRMLPFTATEKDCVAEDGGPQECTICMEDYEVGHALARLECLCKFHKACIVGWLEKKMECPVHKAN
ncbi:hypothetical protein AJ78_03755 [Emergomyces pasteurianus Ep9510]|uniref:RING-type E3 ubiquitin transferase n=1 Tax=Emergomyces pasteurianus Ep9510 TaxID=1447872 RepID=A0A1J9PJG3_9EURO|nr:hypothetical protein AJ78_03755 [Emergomyces pasteurianus Ep9510]